MIICFFGPDGSGKSTLAEILAGEFKRRGAKVVVSWMRGSHTLAFLLARVMSRFEVFKGLCNPYYGICIPQSMKSLWLWIEFISILPVIVARFLTPKMLGYTVIAERSPIDFLVWLIITLRDKSILKNFVGRCVISMALALSDKNIYVRASQEVLLSRRAGLRDESLIPLELRVYDAIAKALKTPHIDTSNSSVRESLDEILKIVGIDY